MHDLHEQQGHACHHPVLQWLCWKKHFYHSGDAHGSTDSDVARCPMCQANITWGGIPVQAYIKQLKKHLAPKAKGERSSRRRRTRPARRKRSAHTTSSRPTQPRLGGS